MNSLDNIPSDLYMLLLSLNRRFFNPNEALKTLELAPSHAKVLIYLIHKGPTSISNIARELGISKPNMTPIIDKLVNAGYVTRYCDTNDRRVVLIKYTDTACSISEALEKLTKEKITEKIKDLNEDELKILAESINNILNLLPKID